MRKKAFCVCLLLLTFSHLIFCGERTIPVDIFLMIDKSLSMGEPGKFESMHEWVQNQLIGQILINGDWITIYEFYGKPVHLLDMTVENDQDREKIVNTINNIQPDGQYTDIGLALDALKSALGKRGTNDRYKIMLLLTDLKQEAPWTSRYAGVEEKYKSPYLAEARIVQHDNWYEITLDMDIQDKVVKTTEELYNSVVTTVSSDSQRIIPVESTEEGTSDINDTGSENTADNAQSPTTDQKRQNKNLAFNPVLLLFPAGIVILLVLFWVFHNSRKRKDEDDEKKSEN